MVGEPLVYSDATMHGDVLTVELSVMLPLTDSDRKGSIVELMKSIQRHVEVEAQAPMVQVTRALLAWLSADTPLSPQTATEQSDQ